MRWLARRRLKANFLYTRLSAIRKLERYGRSETASIANMLSDPANEVRIGACEVLGRLKNPDAIARLGDLMLGRFGLGNSGNSRFAAAAAAKALGQIGDPTAIPLLIQALGSSDEYLCAHAAIALGHLRATAAVELLIRQFASNHGDAGLIHHKAVVALANIGGERANAFVLEVFEQGKHLYNNDARPSIALEIWAYAAKGYPIDAQIVAATQVLAENERRRSKLAEFGDIAL
jgi:HEAT repeat protein